MMIDTMCHSPSHHHHHHRSPIFQFACNTWLKSHLKTRQRCGHKRRDIFNLKFNEVKIDISEVIILPFEQAHQLFEKKLSH